jgi:hypothetical protein
MRKTITLAGLATALLVAQYAAAGECVAADLHVTPANQGGLCAQVISCGTKNGRRKEYPTPCAARDDSATHIAPKDGPVC